jgi:ribosome-binding protein aMBF1 (putative translation factor)
MDEKRRAELKAKGWVETTVEELFGLDEVDMQVVELRVRLAREVRRRREESGMSQGALARRIETSQPRMARIEGGQSGVSLDQLVNAFLATGGSLAELGEVIARSSRSREERKG